MTGTATCGWHISLRRVRGLFSLTTMADKKSGAQRPSQRRKESADGSDHVPAKGAEGSGRTGSGKAQASAPSGSFVYPVRSLLVNVEPREGASGQDTTTSAKTAGGPDDLLALGKKEGISTTSRVARTPDGAVVFPQFAGAATSIPSMSKHADDNGEVRRIVLMIICLMS